jgi:glycosyltransferase involved in cell wall biosynthesis
MGPAPTGGYGVHHVATQLLAGLADQGLQLDCFVAAQPSDIALRLRDAGGLTFVLEPPRWSWERWYARTSVSAHFTAQVARVAAQRTLERRLVERHRDKPYDLYYQFSQPELLLSRGARQVLPRIALHPQVHASGELAGLWHDRRLPRTIATRGGAVAAAGMFAVRAARQRSDLRRADLVVSPSQAFARALESDYRLDAGRVRVVPNPVDLDRFRPGEARGDGRIVLLYVAFLAVRKGVELFVELSHRLADLQDRVELVAVGGPRWWSDYRFLLDGIDARVASYVGEREPGELPAVYAGADGLLVPSHYEPFGLTVAEGLASGLGVTASSAVGAIEEVSADCLWTFPAGDADAFERAVRAMVATLRDEREHVRQRARAEAERLFDERQVAGALAEHLREVAA